MPIQFLETPTTMVNSKVRTRGFTTTVKNADGDGEQNFGFVSAAITLAEWSICATSAFTLDAGTGTIVHDGSTIVTTAVGMDTGTRSNYAPLGSYAHPAVTQANVTGAGRLGARFTCVQSTFGSSMWGTAIKYTVDPPYDTRGIVMFGGPGTDFAKTDSFGYGFYTMGAPGGYLVEAGLGATHSYTQMPWAVRGSLRDFTVVTFSGTNFPIIVTPVVNGTPQGFQTITTCGGTGFEVITGQGAPFTVQTPGDRVGILLNARSWATGSFWNGVVVGHFYST
jgi:hypothetical protein